MIQFTYYKQIKIVQSSKFQFVYNFFIFSMIFCEFFVFFFILNLLDFFSAKICHYLIVKIFITSFIVL